VLVELSVMEQRYQAVLGVLRDGFSVTDVAVKWGVSRQSLHTWIARYHDGGLAALEDRSHRPVSCPHETPPAVQVMVCELRRQYPFWGPARIVYRLARDGVDPVPSRSAVYRCLVRHGLIEPTRRRRRRRDYRRWERARPMELWQLDTIGGMLIAGREHTIVTGVDDHSRFCVIASVVERATSRAVCVAFSHALDRYGPPAEVLTDNAKVFTGRHGPTPSEVLFDRICRQHTIKHRLTAVRSPTTTGKVERFHGTLRVEFLATGVFTDLAHGQGDLDAWVDDYNTHRPHQALDMHTPADRFWNRPTPPDPPAATNQSDKPPPAPVIDGQWLTRRVASNGIMFVDNQVFSVGRHHAGAIVDVCVTDQLIHVWHRGEPLKTTIRQRPGPVRVTNTRSETVKHQPTTKRPASTDT
jgi:transposase InsO family protein